jgi:hypothetical protein
MPAKYTKTGTERTSISAIFRFDGFLTRTPHLHDGGLTKAA